MSNIESTVSLKEENIRLTEELRHCQIEKADLQAMVRKLEEEKGALREEIQRLSFSQGGDKAAQDCQLGAHFPDDLLPYTKRNHG